jgi:hypothetical protein
MQCLGASSSNSLSSVISYSGLMSFKILSHLLVSVFVLIHWHRVILASPRLKIVEWFVWHRAQNLALWGPFLLKVVILLVSLAFESAIHFFMSQVWLLSANLTTVIFICIKFPSFIALQDGILSNLLAVILIGDVENILNALSKGSCLFTLERCLLYCIELPLIVNSSSKLVFANEVLILESDSFIRIEWTQVGLIIVAVEE